MQQKGDLLQIFFCKKMVFYERLDDYQKKAVVYEKILNKPPHFKK
ncbi:hypothetical protein [Avibacterium sp. 20-129]|nr:hypothetical protein [Avibacterium sp. 20-129]